MIIIIMIIHWKKSIQLKAKIDSSAELPEHLQKLNSSVDLVTVFRIQRVKDASETFPLSRDPRRVKA